VHTSEERVQIARKAFENLDAKFEEGISISKESVLESKSAVVELELGTAIARVDYSIALASLSVAQGTLLNEVAVFCGTEYSGSEISVATYPPEQPSSDRSSTLAQNKPLKMDNGTSTVTLGKPDVNDPQMANAVITMGRRLPSSQKTMES